MDLSTHPTIRALAETDEDLIRFLGPTERAMVRLSKEIVERHRNG